MVTACASGSRFPQHCMHYKLDDYYCGLLVFERDLRDFLVCIIHTNLKFSPIVGSISHNHLRRFLSQSLPLENFCGNLSTDIFSNPVNRHTNRPRQKHNLLLEV